MPSGALYPFESRWYGSSVGMVHYVDEGEGPVILLSHGNPTWSFLYRDIVKGLRDRFRCIAMDLPGFGLSVRPIDYGYTPAEHAGVLGELVDHLGLEDFVVMGQDWGGPIGLRVAADRADRVRGLVLGSTWFWPETGLGYRTAARVLSMAFFADRLARPSSIVGGFMWRFFANPLSDEVKAHYEGVQPDYPARVGVREFPRQLTAADDWLAALDTDVRQRLGSKRTLVVWGMRDANFEPEHAIPRFTDVFADHVLLKLPHARHFIQEDAPDEIVAAIRDRFGS